MASDPEVPRAFDTAVYVSEHDYATASWRRVAVFRDAQFRDVTSGFLPGRVMQLRVAKDADEETGTYLDVDGDRAFASFEMAGAEVQLGNGSISAVGFIDPAENDPDYTRGGSYRLRRWTQVPFARIQRRDEQRAENAKLADKLSDRDKRILVAMRQWALDHRDAATPNEDWVRIPAGDSVQLPVAGKVVTVRDKDMQRLFDSPIGELIMSTGDSIRYIDGRGRVTVRSYHLLSVAEDIADSILGHTGD